MIRFRFMTDRSFRKGGKTRTSHGVIMLQLLKESSQVTQEEWFCHIPTSKDVDFFDFTGSIWETSPVMRATYQILQERLLAFLTSPNDEFEALALATFEFQWTHNAPYRAFCESVGWTAARVRTWKDIPPVPPHAFKAGPPLSCLPLEECEREFLTSGTTQEVKGRHWMGELKLYQQAVTSGWNRLSLPDDDRWFLARHPSETPQSSLGHMFETLHQDGPSERWLLQEDSSIAEDSLRVRCRETRPLLLFATALALRHFLETNPSPLPAGSRIFQTGGYKGIKEDYDPAVLYQALEHELGVPSGHVVNEYGMTELSSQAYAIGLTDPHRTPPWLRVCSIDPETNQPNPGNPGHLVFYDLANLNSVIAIRTHDLGIVEDEHTFRLAGRDPSADLRGCSRASDSFLRS